MPTSESHARATLPEVPRAAEPYPGARIAHRDAVARRTASAIRAGQHCRRRLAEVYRFLAPPGLRVHELGCGSGDLLAAFDRHTAWGWTSPRRWKIVDLPIRDRERVYGQTSIRRWRHGWLLVRMVGLAARRFKFR
jgi:hypothetical protein